MSPPPTSGLVPGGTSAISVQLRRVTARLILALRACGAGLPLSRIRLDLALAVICPPLLRVRRTMTALVHSISWTLTRMTFRPVLALIRNFHDMEEPAGVPSARCKTSLASIYGLMSETSPAFHLPTSPLLQSLLDDTNSAV